MSSLETKSLISGVNSRSSVSSSNESLEVSNSAGLSVSVKLESHISNFVSTLRDGENGSRVRSGGDVEKTGKGAFGKGFSEHILLLIN